MKYVKTKHKPAESSQRITSVGNAKVTTAAQLDQTANMSMVICSMRRKKSREMLSKRRDLDF